MHKAADLENGCPCAVCSSQDAKTEEKMRLLANYLIDKFLEESENGDLKSEIKDTIVEE